MYKLPLSLNQKDVLLISHGCWGKKQLPQAQRWHRGPQAGLSKKNFMC